MSSAVFVPLIILTSCLVSSGSSEGHRLKVIAGDTIDFQCVTERGEADNVEYLPNFERINDDGSWTTLFVGANPRPGTELSKWLVSVDDESVFHYRLLSASLADGGHYRCENVNTFHHPLNVFAPVLDCGESLPEVGDVDAFRPVCRVETSGPETDDDADSPSTLKWVVDGAEEGSVKSATTTNSSFLEAMLTEGLTEEHHGKTISCVLDAGIRREVENPNCVLGPLNISFNVKVKSISESRADDCHRFDLVLTGNPRPMLQFVTVEDPSGIVESGISYSTSGSSGDVDVHLRACDLVDSNVVALVNYEGVLVTSVEFTAIDQAVEEEAPIVSTSDSSPVIAAVAVIIVLTIAVAAGVAFYLHRRKQAAKPVDDVEAQEEEVKGEEVEEKEDEKKKEEVEKVEEEKTEEEKVEEEKVEDEKQEVKEGLETAVVAEIDADKLAEVEGESDAALKAKLSVLEDVEGVKMIDDSLNEGKEDTPGVDKENVDV